MAYLDLNGLSRFYAGLKDKFLLQSNVANDLTTETAGKALDARQGKALKDAANEAVKDYTEKIKQSASPYVHSKEGTVHNFAGVGRLGFATMTAEYASGDTVTMNGNEVEVVGDLSEAIEDASVLFSTEGGKMYVYDVSSPFVIPNGETVMTLNDARIWLSCAGIVPTSVGSPTIDQIVADESLCGVLMNSDNAVCYLVRSQNIQTKVLSSATAIAALDASNPFVSAVMTSDSAPAGYVATAYSCFDGHAAYSATSQTSGKSWTASTWNLPQWVCVKLPDPIWAYQVKAIATSSNTSATVVSVIQASSDGTNWIDVSQNCSQVNGSKNYVAYAMKPMGRYQYFRVNIVSNSGNYPPWVWGLQIRGKEV